MGCTQEIESLEVEMIPDDNTFSEVELVTPKDHHLLVEWDSDAMERGNHDYETSEHGELVIEPNYDPLERGDVIYYKMVELEMKKNPNILEHYLGRVVGLPGETVEIKDGRVYIDEQVLDTFYGRAVMHGMDEETYFEKMNPSNIVDEQSSRDYFNTNMEPIIVEEDTVFVLVDQWWRGTDSKNFGLLPLERVQGKVLGYSK